MSVTRYQFKVRGKQWVLATDHDEEVARLKAEVERLTFDPISCWDEHGEWMPMHTHLAAVERIKAENARLKAEVEELTIVINGFEKQLDHEMDKSAMLCGQVERLTKAGDKMAHIHRFVGFPSYTLEWEAAKEGKQS